MKYNLAWLQAEAAKVNNLKYLFFWGHQPSNDGQITKSCFSQWWVATFIHEQTTFSSAEHWMMAEKARLFNDTETYDRILTCKTPAEAKKLGRMVQGFDQNIWEQQSYAIVVQGNYLKFSQHTALKEFLLQTQDRVLVEASPVDPIWGIGLAEDHPDVLDPDKWKGTNLLGFALMEVRDQLKI